MEMFFEYWPYMNMVASRLGQKPIQPVEVMHASDGYIYRLLRRRASVARISSR